jgi:hypothetical protein
MDKPDVGPIEGEPPAELLIEDITPARTSPRVTARRPGPGSR